jgi:F0F1-type ATP synthase delta subunit
VLFFTVTKKGTDKLLRWAESSCTAYTALLQFFKHFLDLASEPNHLRKLSETAEAAERRKQARDAEVDAATLAMNGMTTTERKKLEVKVKNGLDQKIRNGHIPSTALAQ